MRKHKLTRVRPDEAAAKQPHTEATHRPPPQNSLIQLQGVIGNQAVQRMLVQREDDGDRPSLEEKAERYLRYRLAQQTKYITRGLESLEGALLPEERGQKFPLVQYYITTYQATGIMTVGMLYDLQQALQPVKVADYVERIFNQLHRDVKYKDEMLEGLDDPKEWYLKETGKWVRR